MCDVITVNLKLEFKFKSLLSRKKNSVCAQCRMTAICLAVFRHRVLPRFKKGHKESFQIDEDKYPMVYICASSRGNVHEDWAFENLFCFFNSFFLNDFAVIIIIYYLRWVRRVAIEMM